MDVVYALQDLTGKRTLLHSRSISEEDQVDMQDEKCNESDRVRPTHSLILPDK
jgi:hypothetical protein